MAFENRRKVKNYGKIINLMTSFNTKKWNKSLNVCKIEGIGKILYIGKQKRRFGFMLFIEKKRKLTWILNHQKTKKRLNVKDHGLPVNVQRRNIVKISRPLKNVVLKIRKMTNHYSSYEY